MIERMLEADHQVLHHMPSDSEWDFDGLVSETSRQVNTLIGEMKAALIIDDSAFAKKGEASAGVARQWNWRLGKVENTQVAVFAALVKETAVSLIDAVSQWLNAQPASAWRRILLRGGEKAPIHRTHDPDSVAKLIAERHQRRQSARDSAYREQNAALLNPSAKPIGGVTK